MSGSHPRAGTPEHTGASGATPRAPEHTAASPHVPPPPRLAPALEQHAQQLHRARARLGQILGAVRAGQPVPQSAVQEILQLQQHIAYAKQQLNAGGAAYYAADHPDDAWQPRRALPAPHSHASPPPAPAYPVVRAAPPAQHPAPRQVVLPAHYGPQAEAQSAQGIRLIGGAAILLGIIALAWHLGQSRATPPVSVPTPAATASVPSQQPTAPGAAAAPTLVPTIPVAPPTAQPTAAPPTPIVVTATPAPITNEQVVQMLRRIGKRTLREETQVRGSAGSKPQPVAIGGAYDYVEVTANYNVWAEVDFNAINASNIVISAGGDSVSVTLPDPRIGTVELVTIGDVETSSWPWTDIAPLRTQAQQDARSRAIQDACSSHILAQVALDAKQRAEETLRILFGNVVVNINSTGPCLDTAP